jgi:hypothetical protein
MDKPCAYALTPIDRALAWKWLLRVAAFYGTIALVVRHHRGQSLSRRPPAAGDG